MMKVLYAIQGTGNGHVSRACDVIPEIKKFADVDILISGYQADLDVPFDVTYRLYGLSFIFGKKGGVDIWETIKRAKIFKFFKEISSVPVEKYDLVINDFEPVTAWACKRKKVPCVSLSHQSAVLHPKAPRPAKTDYMGYFVLKYYAPTQKKYGIHFKEFGENIFTPVVRNDMRNADNRNLGHYTIYLPSFDDQFLITLCNQIPDINWEIFSKNSKILSVFGNVTIFPVSHKAFVTSMTSCAGIFCGAGFETPAEALFLGKKLMVIPMKNQYEQACNAEALRSMGIPVIYNLTLQSVEKIKQWTTFGKTVSVNYANNTYSMVEKVFKDWEASHD